MITSTLSIQAISSRQCLAMRIIRLQFVRACRGYQSFNRLCQSRCQNRSQSGFQTSHQGSWSRGLCWAPMLGLCSSRLVSLVSLLCQPQVRQAGLQKSSWAPDRACVVRPPLLRALGRTSASISGSLSVGGVSRWVVCVQV